MRGPVEVNGLQRSPPSQAILQLYIYTEYVSTVLQITEQPPHTFHDTFEQRQAGKGAHTYSPENWIKRMKREI